MREEAGESRQRDRRCGHAGWLVFLRSTFNEMDEAARERRRRRVVLSGRGRGQRMAKDKDRGTKPEATAETKLTEKPKRAKNKKALVKQAIQQFGKKLDSNELKPTVGDFLRLLQIEKELLEETPKEIKVSWVEPEEKEHAPEK
jgi:hypothetical protein